MVTSGATWPTSDVSAVPTLPATATGSAASRWMWPIHSVVVVLPLVPVTAMNSFAMSLHASSSSPTTARPCALAATTAGAFWGTPGLLMSVRARAARTSPDASRWTSTPASESLPAACARPGLPAEPESTPITSSPRSRNVSAAATPERAKPTTRYGPGGSGGRRLPTDRELIQREADRGERCGDDPEAQDDLRLRPPLQL